MRKKKDDDWDWPDFVPVPGEKCQRIFQNQTTGKQRVCKGQMYIDGSNSLMCVKCFLSKPMDKKDIELLVNRPVTMLTDEEFNRIYPTYPAKKPKVKKDKKAVIENHKPKSKTGYKSIESNGKGNKNGGKKRKERKKAGYTPKPKHTIEERRKSKKIAFEAMRPVLVTV